MVYSRSGTTYQVRVGDLLSVSGVPITRQVIAGTGLTGGGQLSSNVTLSVGSKAINGPLLEDTGVTAGVYGSSTSVPVLTVDSTGRVTAATSSPVTVSGYVPTSRQVIAGDGLTGGGPLNADVTLSVDLSNATPQVQNDAGSAGVALSVSRSDHAHPAIDLTQDSQVDGILGLDHGGTARSLVMNPGAVVWSGSDGLYITSVGTSGKVLVSNGTSAPSWGTAVIITEQPANVIFAGPASGVDADAAFRLMVNDDLPNSGATAGSYGSGASIPVLSVNGKGVITAVSAANIAPPWSSITATPTTIAGYGITDGVTLTGTQTLTGKTMSGASNTFTNIPTSALSSSSVTFNGTTVALGGSGTITANTSNSLTFDNSGSGAASGAAFNGGAAYTISYNTVGASPLAGSSSLNTLGTVTTGTWNATPISNSYLANSSITVGTTSISLGSSSLTLGGLTSVTLTQDPTSALQAATKQYVDAAISNTNYHPACNYATTADLGSVTYNNGSSGVGATLTNAGTQAALVIDGHTFTATDVTNGVRVLVKNETSGQYNGAYVVTNQGSGSTNWVLTRATDYDQVGTGEGEVAPGDTVFVISGTVNASTQWVQTTGLPITLGTTPIAFTQVGSATSYTAGTGLSLVGTQFSVANTGVTATTYGSASSVPTIAVNAQGQITSASNTSIAINGNQITSGTVGSAYLSGSYTGITGLGTVTTGTWNGSTLSVPYGGTGATTLTGLVKGNGTSAYTAAVSGTDYAPATSGTSILYGNGAGGFSSVTVGSGLTFVGGTLASTSGGGSVTSVALSMPSGFSVSGSPVTGSGTLAVTTALSGILKGTGTGFTTATSGTDYAPATSGSAILYGNGLGGFSSVTIGSGVSFAGGTLSATGVSTYPSAGIAVSTGSAWGTSLTAPSGTIVGTTDTQTLTNKRVTPRIQSVASASTITPTGDTADQYEVTALAVPATIAAPSGTPTDGQRLMLRIIDNGTSRALTWTTTAGAYRARNVLLPTATVASSQMYVGCVYNSADGYWDVLSVSTGSSAAVGTVTSVDVSGGTTGLTTSGGPITTNGTITLAGTLATTNGGTGLTSFTSGGAVYASSTSALTTGTLPAASGGTGQSSYAVGDLLYASTTSALSKLADVATGNALISGGVGVAPSWGKIGLTTHVSGTLPIANGGTNATATPTAGAVSYGTGTAYAFTAAGTAGQVLTSAGSGTPTWSGINGGTF